MKITALAGGVGGAKLITGLSRILAPEELSVIVNTADDFWFHGLYISPDIDTIIYNLAGINQPAQGWGIDQDTFNFLSELEKHGMESWFKVGDRDLVTHLIRTSMMQNHHSLTTITETLCKMRGVKVEVLPMADQLVATMINTEELGELPFQEYFVKYGFFPRVKSIKFNGIELSTISEKLQSKVSESDLVVICPSNPFVSIAPILAVNGLKDLLLNKTVIAVSPLIGGKAVKGPAAKMFEELGYVPSGESIARFYQGIVQGLIIDTIDSAQRTEIERCGIILKVTDTLMSNENQKIRLAQEVIDFGKEVIQAN